MNLRRFEKLPASARGWLIPAALLALMPKCALCVLAYAGLGAALGVGGREMCGAPADATACWTTALAAIGAAAAVAGLLVRRRRRHHCAEGSPGSTAP
jgi:uncharacterized membrane protein YjjB (DUF3815 family)